MRTSLRDARNLDPKNIIVPDERLAQRLCEMLPGAKLKKLDSGIADEVDRGGRPKVHANNAVKFRRRREMEKEKRTELLNQVFSLNGGQNDSEAYCSSNSDPGMRRNETSISVHSSLVAEHQYFATIYSHLKSTTPEGYLACANQESFVAAMAALHAQTRDSKDAILLFSPAIFDPNREVHDKAGKRTRRGVGNIVSLQNIVLDLENSELGPDQLPALYPRSANDRHKQFSPHKPRSTIQGHYPDEQAHGSAGL